MIRYYSLLCAILCEVRYVLAREKNILDKMGLQSPYIFLFSVANPGAHFRPKTPGAHSYHP
jgi:hypothetical protein